MSATETADARLRVVAPLYLGRLEAADAVNPALLTRYLALRDHPSTRRTHAFAGRFENTYVDRHLMPELRPVTEAALHYAQTLLRRDRLRFGCWFNEMGPGDRTTLHSHDDDDELLSGVYYVTAPPQCGRLEVHDGPVRLYVEPEAGRFVFFDPALPHAVEPNRSTALRLSIAFNFGPAD